jgi:hypothetical protein
MFITMDSDYWVWMWNVQRGLSYQWHRKEKATEVLQFEWKWSSEGTGDHKAVLDIKVAGSAYLASSPNPENC